MKTKINNLGYTLISVLLIQVAFSILSIKVSLNFMELKDFTQSSSISSTQLISEIIASSLLILSILIFLFKSKAGIILYIFSTIIPLIIAIVFGTLTLKGFIISLALPVLTLLLTYTKRDLLF